LDGLNIPGREHVNGHTGVFGSGFGSCGGGGGRNVRGKGCGGVGGLRGNVDFLGVERRIFAVEGDLLLRVIANFSRRKAIGTLSYGKKTFVGTINGPHGGVVLEVLFSVRCSSTVQNHENHT
jgi:hypothetical protein